MKTIAVVDYGMGNVMSVKKALDYVAANTTVILTHDKNIIAAADKVVFPGQGAIGGCIDAINKHKLQEVIKTSIAEKPFLGICLGLQVLFDSCEENDGVAGLGVLAGSVKKFPDKGLKIPQIGWNEVHQEQAHPLWYGIAQNSRFYTVHSYYAAPQDSRVVFGSTEYGINYASAVANENLFAVQFHPEKSQNQGLAFIKNFVNWRGV